MRTTVARAAGAHAGPDQPAPGLQHRDLRRGPVQPAIHAPQPERYASADAGQVYAILDRDNDHKADEVITIDSGLNVPNGVAFRDGSLYVAEINRILRYDRIESRLDNAPEPVVVNGTFPTDWMHGWKNIAFGPDGKLYVPVGAPCNVCDRADEEPRYASITRMNPDGGDLEVFASGIRNSVGFDWHPDTGELWFTSNGRDGLGDETPPDVLNRAARSGLHFGFPYCHAGTVPDPQFGEGQRVHGGISFRDRASGRPHRAGPRTTRRPHRVGAGRFVSASTKHRKRSELTRTRDSDSAVGE